MSTITLASPPSTASAASQILALMASESGVTTDYNIGSQIRTLAESIGSVIEQQGVWGQALAFQALTYGALSLFGITPGVAVSASGTVTFQTGSGGSPPPASQNVSIPAGTIVQTNGGVQFQTTALVTLGAGSSSVDASVVALVAGSTGNVTVGAINNIVTGLTYPLFVTNAAVTSGGADAQTPAQAIALFTAQVASIGLSSPVAIANAAIGVSVGGETVAYSTLYEPWIAAGSGAGSGVASWTLILDNGHGTASAALVAAVDTKLGGGSVSGSANASGAIGYRDAGVPYNILAVTGTYADVSVSGTLSSSANAALVSGAIAAAVSGYFTLPFGAPAERASLSAAVANAALGQLTALVVSLYSSGTVTPDLPTLTCPVSGRVLLNTVNVHLS